MNVVILGGWPHARSSCRHASKLGRGMDQRPGGRGGGGRSFQEREIRVALAMSKVTKGSKVNLTIAPSPLEPSTTPAHWVCTIHLEYASHASQTILPAIDGGRQTSTDDHHLLPPVCCDELDLIQTR
jgi:hypothetical protein